ncbi:MAG: hypothetical protein QM529_04630 [Hydrotalea sp.]|nr:hypothetical protein [Hydrotalea sp.]
MKNKLSTKITATLLIALTLSSAVFTTHANAQNAGNKANVGNGTGANGPLLANAVAGKLMLKADVGYVYSFAGDWSKTGGSNPGDNKSKSTGGVGYGVSLGWTSKSGFGLSADYLGFNHKWSGGGTGTNAGMEYNYDAPYHVMTITPSYRFKLDSADNWGLRVGLGVGFSLSDVSWAKNLSASGAQVKAGVKVAGGAVYAINDATVFCADSIGGSSPVNLAVGQCVISAQGFPSAPNSGTGYNFSDDNNAVDSINNEVVYFEYQNGTVSYGLWRQLTGVTSNTDRTNALAQLNRNNPPNTTAITSVSIFESRADYVTRFGGGATGEAAAAAVEARVTAAAQAAAQAAAAAKLAQDTAACDVKAAQGYTWNGTTCNAPAPSADSAGGSAKDDAGFVLVPQVALEYDNNLLHFDINVKYIHGLLDVRYFGSEGSVSGTTTSGAITYTSKAGPLALFIGAGLGINF